jgi:hypothetical protein
MFTIEPSSGINPLLARRRYTTGLRQRPRTPARDELQVPAGAQSEPAPLLHRWKGSSDALAAVSMART